MSVAIHVGDNTYSIGSARFYDSFFATIKIRLESGVAGSLYPNVMSMRSGTELKKSQAKNVLLELKKIQVEFAKLPPTDYIYNEEDIHEQPPWANNISPEIKNLAQYFITDEGEDLFDVFEQALTECIESGNPVILPFDDEDTADQSDITSYYITINLTREKASDDFLLGLVQNLIVFTPKYVIGENSTNGRKRKYTVDTLTKCLKEELSSDKTNGS